MSESIDTTQLRVRVRVQDAGGEREEWWTFERLYELISARTQADMMAGLHESNAENTARLDAKLRGKSTE